VIAAEEYLQHSISVVDEDRLFISGTSVVEILNDNRPINRSSGFFPMRVRVLFPQPEMAEDALYDVGFMIAASAASGRT
jgi:hypothetical protein